MNNNGIENFYLNGYKTSELKETVEGVLSQFFEHKEVLNQYWCDAEIIKTFELVVRYYNTENFIANLRSLVNLYQNAYKKCPNQTLDMIVNNYVEFSHVENKIFCEKERFFDLKNKDTYEQLVGMMDFSEKLLEIAIKPAVAELVACLKLSECGQVNYQSIKDTKFGCNIKVLIDKTDVGKLFQLNPNNIKLSDWRNIVCHSDYSIDSNMYITCTYGKKKTFTLNNGEFNLYIKQIKQTNNILGLARMIFIYDYFDLIDSYITKNYPEIRSKLFIIDCCKNHRLDYSLASQGYKVLNITEEETTITFDLKDLIDTSTSTLEYQKSRWINTARYLMIFWQFYPKSTIVANYYSKNNINEFSCNVDGDTCKKVLKNNENVKSFLSQVNQEMKI